MHTDPGSQPPDKQNLLIDRTGTVLRDTALRTGNVEIIANQNYLKYCENRFENAKRAIVVSMGLMVITKWKAHPTHRLLDQLIAARNRGIHISVFTAENTGSGKANELAIKKLRDSKVVVTLRSSNRACHHKAIVIDGELSVIGSHNWTAPSLTHLNEISVAVHSETFAARTMQAIARTYSQLPVSIQ